MNKYDFLRKLDKELSALDLAERKELLAFYEERFYTGTIYENKTEEQVIAELESPEQIARNILTEYGISTPNRFRRNEHISESERPLRQEQRTERPTNNEQRTERPRSNVEKTDNAINSGALIGLICVDLFVLSWAIPTLYSVVIAMVPALLSYIGVFGFLIGGTTTLEVTSFWVFTGVYYLLFLATLGIIELTIWTTKKALLYHLRVFKYKNYKNVNRRLSKISIEGWFKRHRFIRFIKNLAGVASVIVIILGGTFVFKNFDEVYQTYVGDNTIESIETFSPEDYQFNSLNIDVDAENVTIKVIKTSGDDIVVSRTYVEQEDETYTVEMTNETLEIVRDIPVQVNLFLSFEDLADWFINDEIVIEIPENLDLNDVNVITTNGSIDLIGKDADTIYLKSTNGSIDVKGVTASSLNVDTSNGGIELFSSTITGLTEMYSTNGSIKVLDSELHKVVLDTSNAKVIMESSIFVNAMINTSNGKVVLDNLTVVDDPELEEYLDVTSSNATLELSEVYVPVIDLFTSNADIEFYNENTSYNIDLQHRTTNGEYEGNVN